jgi:hypothetical protein
MNNNDKQPVELRTNVNWTNYYNSNYSKSIDYESNDKKQDYEIKRDAIAKMEGITEAQKVFGKWIDYIAKISNTNRRKARTHFNYLYLL